MKNRKIYGFRLRFSLNQLTGGKSPNLGTQIIQVIGFLFRWWFDKAWVFLGMWRGIPSFGVNDGYPPIWESWFFVSKIVWKMSFNPRFGFEDEDMDAPKMLTSIGKMWMNHERNGYRPSDIGPDWMIFRGPPSKESHKDLLTHPP